MSSGLSTFAGFGLSIAPDDPDLRAKILYLESVLMNVPDEFKIEVPILNHFSNGVYAREMRMPKDCLVIGKIHRFENMSIVSKGVVSVLTEFNVEQYRAGDVVIAPAGVKRVLFAHEETYWTTVHAVGGMTNPDEIIEYLTVKTYKDVPPAGRLLNVQGGGSCQQLR